jgi:hypothetical protein
MLLKRYQNGGTTTGVIAPTGGVTLPEYTTKKYKDPSGREFLYNDLPMGYRRMVDLSNEYTVMRHPQTGELVYTHTPGLRGETVMNTQQSSVDVNKTAVGQGHGTFEPSQDYGSGRKMATQYNPVTGKMEKVFLDLVGKEYPVGVYGEKIQQQSKGGILYK